MGRPKSSKAQCFDQLAMQKKYPRYFEFNKIVQKSLSKYPGKVKYTSPKGLLLLNQIPYSSVSQPTGPVSVPRHYRHQVHAIDILFPGQYCPQSK